MRLPHLLLLCVLAVLPILSHAKMDRTAELIWNITGNTASGSIKSPGGATSLPDIQPSSSGATISGNKPLPWPGKSQAENMARWKMMANARNIAKSVMNPGAAAISLIGGTAIKQLIDLACVRVMGGVLKEGAVWDECVPGTGTDAPQSNGYRYYMTGGEQRYATFAEMCTAYAAKEQASAPGYTVTATPGSESGGVAYCMTVYKQGNNPPSAPVARQHYRESNVACPSGHYIYPDGSCSATPPAPQWQSADPQNVEDKLEDRLRQWCQSGDPRCTDSIRDLLRGGGRVQTDSDVPTVEGPARTDGPTKTETRTRKTTAPDGTVVTETTTITTTITNNYTYNDNTVVNRPTTKTTTTNPDGTTSEETTEEECEEGSECANEVTDTPLSDLPKLYERKYPDGLVGVWNTKRAEFLATSIGQLSTQLMPTISGAGSCPSWPIDLDLQTWNFGTVDVAPPCWIWDFAKAVIVISALLLARALIFGG